MSEQRLQQASSWTKRREEKERRMQAVTRWMSGPVLPTDKTVEALEALVVAGDRIVLEGDIYWSRKLLTLLFLIEPFIMLGKASLQVFCAHLAHLAFVFAGLAVLYGTVSQLHGLSAVGLVALTFVGLIFVALRKIRRERRQTINNPELKIEPSPTYIEA
jgi:hypothetical protein